MPLYMTQFAYTPEAWAELARNPEDRSEPVRGLLESMGGRMSLLPFQLRGVRWCDHLRGPRRHHRGGWRSGRRDAGHIKAVKTTNLLSVEDAMGTMPKAGDVTYRGPGQA